MKHILRLALSVALLVAGIGAAVCTAQTRAASAATSSVYSDPAGDVSAGVPDITDVSVSNPSSSEIDFSVMLDHANFGAGFFLDIFLYPNGSSSAQYLIRLDGGRSVITAYDLRSGSAVAFTASLLGATTSLTPERIQLGTGDIGNPSSFNFQILAWNYDPNASPACCYDQAGLWHFDLAGSTTTTTTAATTTTPSTTTTRSHPPAPTAPTTPSLPSTPTSTTTTTTTTAATTTTTTPTTTTIPTRTIPIARLSVRPVGSARSGHRFALRIKSTMQITSVACSASAGGKPLATEIALNGGAASCAMSLASSRRGTSLRVAVKATVSGKHLTARYTTHIS